MTAKVSTSEQATPARDNDDYLAALPEDARAALKKLRKTIRAAVPRATEVISYQIPTFKYQGRSRHSLHSRTTAASIMSKAVMDAHKDQLKAYDTSGVTIRFPASKPLPLPGFDD